MYRLQRVTYWQDFFRSLGIGTISPAWLENINSRLENKLQLSGEQIIYAIPILERKGCDSSTLPNSVIVRSVELGNFKNGGYMENYSRGSLALMDDPFVFTDGYFIATDRRFILASTERITEYAYTDVRTVVVVEDVAIFHTAFIEFPDETLRAQFCFPSAGILVGGTAMQNSQEGRTDTWAQRKVGSANEAAREAATYIRKFLDDVLDVVNRARTG